MNWQDVAKLIAPLAPTVGGVLGGFIPVPGASLAGQALGTLIAKQFGVEATPDNVHAAIIAADRDVAIAKLRAAGDEARERYAGWAQVELAVARLDASALETVNVTMRAEAAAGRFTWRDAVGWVLAGECAALALLLVAGLILTAVGQPALWAALQAGWATVLAALGIPSAIVGVKLVNNERPVVPPPPVLTAAPVDRSAAPPARNR